MSYPIRTVAVLGAGVMGQGIAAHLANAGVPSILFDIVPRSLGAKEPRSKLAIDGIANASKLKPAAFFKNELSALIKPANYEDDGALLASCDLIIEVVVERLDIKTKVYEWVATHRRPGSIVASNTSGLKLVDMAASMPAEMRQHFLITHFFNPVRYMRLLELVSGPETLPAVTAALARFGERKLGKGIVYAKDTPNFIANRIGTFGIVSVFHHMQELGMTVEEVDAIFGKPMGRPKSAVFRTADLVGLDTLDHVLANVYDGCPDDERRDWFVSPPWLKAMVAEGALGDKTGKGFYQKQKGDGGKTILARNVQTGAYAPAAKVRFASLGAARNYADDPGASTRIILGGDDKAAQIGWRCTADTLLYSANRIPEIADDIVNIDRGMKWGFGWDLGPFEGWDAIGVAESVARMEAEGRVIPAWVSAMLAAGRSSFYARDAAGQMTYWDPQSASAKPVPVSDDWLLLSDVKAKGNRVVSSNDSADLLDIGDGVACLSFHSKMNAIDDGIIALYEEALDKLDAGTFEALVVGNQGGVAFCAGANLMMVGAAAMSGEWEQLGAMIARLQGVLQRAKYSRKPVVVAPWGLTLGGGAEIAMQCSHTRAAGELYMGLVEVGVGLIPAGGGCKEMLSRYLGDIPEGTEYDPNPFVQQAFKNIALASVATSAEQARALGYLRPTDSLTLDPDALIQSAKKAALGLAEGGFVPPHKRRFKLPGAQGRAAIELFLYQMREGGYATPHDLVVSKQLARVMTGGDVPAGTWVTEERVLELEREAFLSLCGTEATQARIMHMLEKGKPLRN